MVTSTVARASEVTTGPAAGSAADLVERLPALLDGATRVVAATVRLPAFLLAASGTVHRLAAHGVPTDVLVAAASRRRVEELEAEALDALGAPGVHRHRLALAAPVHARHADVLAAALSELIGFDPEPGVVLLLPPDGDQGESALHEVGADLARIYPLRLVSWLAPADGGADLPSPHVELRLTEREWMAKTAAVRRCAGPDAPAPPSWERFGPA